MTKFYSLFLLLITSFTFTQAQELSYHTEKLPAQARKAVVNISQLGPDYAQSLVSLEAPSPSGDGYKAYLRRAKRESARMFPARDEVRISSRADVDPPILRSDFSGSTAPTGIPLDTHIAVSDDGQVITVINSGMLFSDTLGTRLRSVSLLNFFDRVGVLGNLFDPKVHYDPAEDKFIVFALSGVRSANLDTIDTYLYFAFSETNDPLGNWNLYRFSGNPLDDNTWLDYPMLSISEQEVFLTLNSIKRGQSWQAGFEQTLIYQVDKSDGFAGDSLDMRIWTDVKFDILTLRNLCPVKGGAGNYGPNHYFLSNRNFDILNTAVFIIEITDTLDAPGVNLKVDVRGTGIPYGLPPRGAQLRLDDSLDTNDARILDAFLFNDKIQFVGNTIDTTNGYGGVFHGEIKQVSTSKIMNGHIISEPPLYFGYPSIAYTGSSDPADNEFDAIIFFDMVARGTFPSITAIYYDGDGGYSDRLLAKSGTDYISVLPPAQFGSERWGDYTGTQRSYNHPGKVWTVGTIGLPIGQAVPWIAEIDRPGGLVSNEPPQPKADVSVFPNPAHSFVNIKFKLPNVQQLKIELFDLQGKLIKTFYDFDPYQQGLMRFSFDTSPLAKGTYLLKITTEQGLLQTEKLQVK